MRSAPQLQQASPTVGVPINVVMCAAAMALCFALTWAIVFMWRIGPVIAMIDAGAGRGVHSGDLLAVPLVGIGVLAHDGLIGRLSR